MMLGLKKEKWKGKSRLRSITLENFATSGAQGKNTVAKEARNCDCRGGRVRRGVGLVMQADESGRRLLAAIPVETMGAYPTWLQVEGGADKKALALIGADNYLYMVNLTTGRGVKKVFCGENPTYLAVKNEKGRIEHVALGSEGVFYSGDGNEYASIASFEAVGGCIAGGRLFVGALPRVIKYTSPYALKEVEEGEGDLSKEIYLPLGEGKLVDVQTDGKSVYAFTEQEIYRLTPASKEENFLLERVGYEGEKIYRGSTVATAKGIIFLAQDGAYRVSGTTAEKVCESLRIQPNGNFVCRVGVCGELALIDYQAKGEGGTLAEKRVAISSDGKDGFFCARYGGLSGGDFCVNGTVVHRFGLDTADGGYQILPYFCSGELDFGSKKRKFLKKLRVEGEGSAKVRVVCQGETASYELRFKGGLAEANTRQKGRAFTFYIQPDEGAEVRRLTIEYEEEVENGY